MTSIKEEKMKKTIISLAAVSTMAMAGGNIVPAVSAVPVVETPVVVDKSAFYLGMGLGSASVNDDFTNEEISNNTVMLQAGYQYNAYVAIEGRYTFGFNTDYDPGNTGNQSSDYDDDFSSWGIYVKPMYPIGDFSIYALLGYGGVMLDSIENGDAYESALQWGLGAGYAFTEEVSIFVDYISLYDDTGFDYRAQLDDIDSDTWTLGVSYKF